MFDDKTILITGGTGSFGNAVTKYLLEEHRPRKIIIFSRDEMKQWAMAAKFKEYKDILRFFIGDVRDRERLYRATFEVDYVIHAAATKIVPTAEYNPFECVKTNVMGAMNLIDACIDNKVDTVVALSTDKASSPSNLYGATKLTSDKLFVAGNTYSGATQTKFVVVRYGNVLGSRGSVIPFFLQEKETGLLPITDFRMTRFMITLAQGIDLVVKAFSTCVGGEIYVKKIPSMKITDIAKACDENAELIEVGIRPGEKIHEEMISTEDSLSTYEYSDHYRILPLLNDWHLDPERINDGIKVPVEFKYSSDTNEEWMSAEKLALWIEQHKNTFLEV